MTETESTAGMAQCSASVLTRYALKTDGASLQLLDQLQLSFAFDYSHVEIADFVVKKNGSPNRLGSAYYIIRDVGGQEDQRQLGSYRLTPVDPALRRRYSHFPGGLRGRQTNRLFRRDE